MASSVDSSIAIISRAKVAKPVVLWESLTLGRASHRWIYRLAKVCGPHRSTAFRTASSVTESLGKDPNGSTTSQQKTIGKAGSSAKDTDKQGQAQVWKRQLAW